MKPSFKIAPAGAEYSDGRVPGTWVDMTQPVHEIIADIDDTLRDVGERFCEVTDYAGWHGYRPDVFDCMTVLDDDAPSRAGALVRLGEVQSTARFVRDYGTMGVELLRIFDSDVGAAREAVDEDYVGHYESMNAWAEEDMASVCTVPSELVGYLDTALWVEHAEREDSVFSISCAYGGVHVFRSR